MAPTSFTVNGRTYTTPAAPAVVICIDGSEPDYDVEAIARETQLVEQLVIGADTRGVARALVIGADTRGVARALGIAEHTVNDHLQSIFAKAGTNSRRRLVANATG